MMNTPDHDLNGYDFELPESLIAQHPAHDRDGSRLLVLRKDTGAVEVSRFKSLSGHLPKNALLVANNSRVLPARLFGHKDTGGRVEMLPLTPLPLIECQDSSQDKGCKATIKCLLRASKGPKPGAEIHFADDLRCIVVERGDFGQSVVELRWQGELRSIMERIGSIPLPPYIHRVSEDEDHARYQTIYSKEEKTGSVAAPTAGLHFTPTIREELARLGHEWAEVTLYVGYGTFSPVRSQDIREHAMHKEYVEVPQATAQAVMKAKQEGRPVVAVGTTSARTLEGMVRECGEIKAFNGETDIFITPGYSFQVVDHLLTNFHLPKSSLIMMVSALAGRESIMNAYQLAVRERFRFFSYGDAMLIL